MQTAPPRHSVAFASVAAIVFILAAPSFVRADEKLLTPDEIRRIDRENEFWRTLRAADDIDANLARLRRRGASDEDLSWFAPRLAEVWNVDVPREWGWLRPEQIEAIKAIDRELVPRLRAARLRAATGIEIDPAHRGESVFAVHARWQRAVLRALDYDQLGEFRLMNSGSAQRAARHFENVPITADERRTIYEWQHEFDVTNGSANGRVDVGRHEATLDLRRRLRELLGDDRFAVYLASVEPNFARMHDALGEEVGSTLALDAWWLREQFWIAYEKPREFAVSSQQIAARYENRLKTRLGDTLFQHYIETADARWLTSFTFRPHRLAKP